MITALERPIHTSAASDDVSSSALSVMAFGAKGDGVTDDYLALRRAARYLCSNPGTTLVCPPGHYYIGQYKIVGGPNKNNVRDVVYSGCNNTTISGYGAFIKTFGGFHRSADVNFGDHTESYESGVIPFRMENSIGFKILGFDVDGSVGDMSRDPNVAEGVKAAILTRNCRDYEIRDVFAHHFHTDGVKLGSSDGVADENANIQNLTAFSNARNGLSVIQLRGGLIQNSKFLDSGRVGIYGLHDPSAGVDVEPNYSTPVMNKQTGSLMFDNDEFTDNLGPQFISTFSTRVDSLTVQNSRVVVSRSDAATTAFLNVARTATTYKNTFVVSKGHTVALAAYDNSRNADIQSISFANNSLQLDDRQGITTPTDLLPIDFRQNTITVNATGPELSPMNFSNIGSVAENHFFISGQGLGKTTGTGPWAVLFHGVSSVQGNEYSTDLSLPRTYQVVYLGTTPTGENYSAGFAPFFSSWPRPAAAPKRTGRVQ